MINIASPSLDKKEKKAVLEVLDSGNLVQGEKVSIFEERFADFIGTKYAIATSNGTTSLHLSLLALGIKEGDEVITSAFSFIASTASILQTGAKPVFVDINPKTFNIDPDLIESKITSRTKAILPVHLYGLPADMEKINQIAKKNNLFVIEDACQSHGAQINGKKSGSFGDIACFSFYSTKNMTSGEGGMIVTNNSKIAEIAKILRNHGMVKRYFHKVLGFNFRMTDITAAIGIEQLKKLPIFNQKRIRNAEFLNSQLSKIAQIVTPNIPFGYTHVFHQYTILVNNGKRNKLADHLKQNGVETRIYYPIPIHKQEFIKNMFPSLTLKQTEEVSTKVLSLPIHPKLTSNDLKKIVKLIKNFYQ